MSNRLPDGRGFASIKSFDTATAKIQLAPKPAIAAAFDYTTLPPELAAKARDAAGRIRGRLHSTIIAIGRDLIAIKREMPHGTFGKWIKAEMGMSRRTAENYMSAARWAEDKCEMVALLPPAIVYALASPAAPIAVVNEVLAAASTGKLMAPAVIRAKLTSAKNHCPAAIEAAVETKSLRLPFAMEYPAARIRRHINKRTREYQQREAHKERERIDRLSPLVQRIAAAIGLQDLSLLNKALAPRRPDRRTTVQLLAAEIEPELI